MVDITTYDPNTLEFTIREEEFESIPHPEDGEMMLGTAVSVSATAPDGTRWIREVGHRSWVAGTDEETGEPVVNPTADLGSIKVAAVKLCSLLNDLVAREETCPRLNRNVWFFAGAVYGSEAYERLGLEEEQAAMERHEWGMD